MIAAPWRDHRPAERRKRLSVQDALRDGEPAIEAGDEEAVIEAMVRAQRRRLPGDLAVFRKVLSPIGRVHRNISGTRNQRCSVAINANSAEARVRMAA